MKLVFITSLFSPYSRGGAEVVVTNLVNALKKQHEVIVITIDRWRGFSSFRPTKTIEDGVTIYRFYPLNIFSFIDIATKPALLRLFWHLFDVVNIHSAAVVKKILFSEKPDVIFTHNIKGIGYTIPRAIKKAGIFHVYTAHDVQLSIPTGTILYGEEHHAKNNFFGVKFYEWLVRWVFGSPDVVVFPSQYLNDFYSKRKFFKQSRCITLPNAIPPEVQLNAVCSVKEHGVTNFTFIGQLGAYKGVKVLVEAFKKMPNKSIRLYIGGTGELNEYANQAAKEDSRIIYLGRIPRENIFKHLCAMHYTVIPSLFNDNSPTVIYESFAAGVPIIASRIGGIPELIHDGQNGYLFEPGNEKDLIALLNKAVENNQYDSFCKNAKETIGNYTMDNYLEKLLVFKK